MLDNGFKQNRWNRQVMGRRFRIPELFAKRREGSRILIVAVDISQQINQLLKSYGIEPAMFLQAVFRPTAKLIEIPSGFGHADHGNVEVSSFHHGLQRRENLLISKVARSAEKNECV